MAKTAREHLATKKSPKKVRLEKDFAGVKAGQLLFVGTPQIVADYISKIPYGKTRTVPRLRNEIARRRRCDAMCPVSTAIFIRIAAEAAVEDLNDGKSPNEVLPFWRLLDSKDKIAKKLSIDGRWIDAQREMETKER